MRRLDVRLDISDTDRDATNAIRASVGDSCRQRQSASVRLARKRRHAASKAPRACSKLRARPLVLGEIAAGIEATAPPPAGCAVGIADALSDHAEPGHRRNRSARSLAGPRVSSGIGYRRLPPRRQNEPLARLFAILAWIARVRRFLPARWALASASSYLDGVTGLAAVVKANIREFSILAPSKGRLSG